MHAQTELKGHTGRYCMLALIFLECASSHDCSSYAVCYCVGLRLFICCRQTIIVSCVAMMPMHPVMMPTNQLYKTILRKCETLTYPKMYLLCCLTARAVGQCQVCHALFGNESMTSWGPWAMLCCDILCCAITLSFAMLHYAWIVLCCIVLCCAVLCCAVLCCAHTQSACFSGNRLKMKVAAAFDICEVVLNCNRLPASTKLMSDRVRHARHECANK